MRFGKRSWLTGGAVAALAVVALVAVGCGGVSYGNSGGGSTSTPPAAGGTSGPSVTILNYAYSPQTLTVRPGTTVVWTNKDSVAHTVTSTDGPGIGAKTTSLFDSGLLNQGQTFSYTFEKAGTYNYECTIHKSMASMHATIVVSASAPAGGSGS